MSDLPSHCTDPGCNYNRRGIHHTCGQCSTLATVKCACYKKHLETKPYTASNIRARVEPEVDELFKPYLTGRPSGYTTSPSFKFEIALGYWLDRELTRVGASDADRKTQGWKFNRLSRSYDAWETAAECLNDVLEGIVEQDHKPHRRWG